jgi:hypothetical protein
MKVRMVLCAIAATLVACGGSPEGEPTAAPAASAAANDGGTPPVDITSDPGGGEKVYCPTCPIQCDPTNGVPCPPGGGGHTQE